MSVPLKDFRVPIPESVHVWLDAEADAFGVDMQEIVRGILKSWARKKAHAYRVATKRMQANGLTMELFGLGDASDTENAGAQRSAPVDAGASRQGSRR